MTEEGNVPVYIVSYDISDGSNAAKMRDTLQQKSGRHVCKSTWTVRFDDAEGGVMLLEELKALINEETDRLFVADCGRFADCVGNGKNNDEDFAKPHTL